MGGGELRGQEQLSPPAQTKVEVPYATRLIRIDAIGHEYEKAAVLHLNRRSQLVSTA